MNKQNNLSAADLVLPLACILIVSTLFAAGLWPFNPFPKNEVTWLVTGKGLHFGDHGVVLSREPLRPAQLNRESFCTLAIRLRSDPFPSGGTLLEVYTPENPTQFRLMQWRDVLLIRKDYRDAKNRLRTAEVDVGHAFLTGESVSFTITSSPGGSVA